VEGFVHRVIDWREFIRGIYQECFERQESGNFSGRHGRLTAHWNDWTTGIFPLDLAIRRAQRWGWTHLIEQLMTIGNLNFRLEKRIHA
jgi:deoxyribodipyrimidine photolyase-like uncharacterized protein